MKKIFKPGDKKEFCRMINATDLATFNDETVHPVYATFSLARDAEWTSRQFVLDMKEPDEEGIGTFLTIEHKAPAFAGEEIKFTAWIDHIDSNELICFFEAKVADRLIAIGKTGQKVLSRANLEKVLSRPMNESL
jgi:fluoroacetyl-CoA thioesterase